MWNTSFLPLDIQVLFLPGSEEVVLFLYLTVSWASFLLDLAMIYNSPVFFFFNHDCCY